MKKITLLILAFYSSIAAVKAVAIHPPDIGGTYKSNDFQLSSDSFHSLKTGDILPELNLSNVINTPDGKIRLGDYRGKLMILDFWATWCAPCVAMIPRLDSIQNEFNDNIQIIGVAYQSAAEVESYFAKAAQFATVKPKFPDILGDNTLVKLFPHTYLPHFVWINGQGRIIGTTDGFAVNRENIRHVLAGEPLNAKQKVDPVLQAYDNHIPIFLDGNSKAGDELIYHSILTGYVEGLMSGITRYPPNEHGAKITARNVPLFWLYREAFEEAKDYFGKNRIVYQVKDTSRLTTELEGEAELEWARAGNSFCYELVVPKKLTDQRYKLMRRDLELVFPQYRAAFEPMERECWVLTRMDEKKELPVPAGKPAASYSANSFDLHNAPVASFINQLNVFYLQFSPYPAVDETHINHPVDISGDAKMSDVTSINKALAKYGLEFIKAKRKIKVLVISDVPESKQP